MKFAAFFVASTLSAQQYFPAGVFNPKTEWLDVAGYSRDLKALHEPSLWELSQKDPNVEVYRFLWLRTFRKPVAVRLIATGNGGRLISKMTSGHGGYDPGYLIRDRARNLSKKDPMFADAIEELHFWDLPTNEPETPDRIVLDGTAWVIEGVKQGRYHVVERTSPDRDDPVHKLGILMLIDLAHFRLLYQEVD